MIELTKYNESYLFVNTNLPLDNENETNNLSNSQILPANRPFQTKLKGLGLLQQQIPTNTN